MPAMLISKELFKAFLECETKSFLKSIGSDEVETEIISWQQCALDDYEQKCHTKLLAGFQQEECLQALSVSLDFKNTRYKLITNCPVPAQEIQSQIHALERLPSPVKAKHSPYIPILFVPNEKITQLDKLLLAFDALALSMASGKMPLSGKIIHGSVQKAVKIQLAGLMKIVRSVVERITAQQASPISPPLILNKHCPECEFQSRCRQVAIEKDDLSLLSHMTERERKKQHDKGIFTVTQLSYTFRPRRKPKRLASKPEKYHHALKALAIRERKLHIAGRPKLDITGTPVYLDVEGVPDRDFYYLIGLRIKSGDSYIQHSFWADDISEEKVIWISFLRTLAKIESPQLIHYGSYETVFLKRMKERYGEAVENPVFLDQLIARSVNLLSVIYAQIYFPTYSNGLKETAQYLGFQWSESNASGLKALMWRSRWESSNDPSLKQKLVTYNVEDCEALQKVAIAVAQLCQRQPEAVAPRDNNIVHTDSLEREYPFRFKKNTFLLPELEYINQSAYWDYQREKIYVRSSQRLKRVSRKSAKSRAKALPINEVVECDFLRPTRCPKCAAQKISKFGRMSKIIHDLKFGRAGIKRWIVKYVFNLYICCQCKSTFVPPRKPWTRDKVGPHLLSYITYQFTVVSLKNNSQAALFKGISDV